MLIEEGALVPPDADRGPTSGWADPVEHARMLHDERRTGDYLAALGEPVRPGDVVLDIGTGSGILAIAAARAGARRGWWEPGINLLGCVFFGISAIAGQVVPSTGSVLDLTAANQNTSLEVACFLANALATLRTGRTAKAPRFRRLRRLEIAVEREADKII